jgi:branched-chain amino acid transport system permease protein
MEIWLIHVVNGISFGALLFIISSGFTLALGMMQIVNIAHGAFYLLGAYLAWTMWELTGNFILAIVVSILPPMIIGIIRGGYPRVMAQPPLLSGTTQLGSFIFPTYRLFIMAVGAGVAIFLWGFLEKTRVGAYVRACVDDEEMARGMGVNVPRLFTFMFGFTCLLGGLGGAIGAAFLGAYQGALIASLFIGILDSLGKGFFPELAHFTLSAPIIIMLAVKPTGLLGRA